MNSSCLRRIRRIPTVVRRLLNRRYFFLIPKFPSRAVSRARGLPRRFSHDGVSASVCACVLTDDVLSGCHGMPGVKSRYRISAARQRKFRCRARRRNRIFRRTNWKENDESAIAERRRGRYLSRLSGALTSRSLSPADVPFLFNSARSYASHRNARTCTS